MHREWTCLGIGARPCAPSSWISPLRDLICIGKSTMEYTVVDKRMNKL